MTPDWKIERRHQQRKYRQNKDNTNVCACPWEPEDNQEAKYSGMCVYC